LLNVLDTPTFEPFLISAIQADKHGLSHGGGNGSMTILDKNSRELLTSTMFQGIYLADCVAARPHVTSDTVSALRTETPVTQSGRIPDAELVHRRYGHIGYSPLADMSKSGSVLNLPSAAELTAKMHDRTVCGPCAEGRHRQASYPRSDAKEVVPYAKLHLDIAERRDPSRAGNRYLLCSLMMLPTSNGCALFATNLTLQTGCGANLKSLYLRVTKF
jgi:hypothetical protein